MLEKVENFGPHVDRDPVLIFKFRENQLNRGLIQQYFGYIAPIK